MTNNDRAGKKIRIGGMAMENGVLFQTPRFWSMAIRNEDGSINVSSGEKKGLARSDILKKVPLLRGLASLTDAVTILPDAHAHGGQLPALFRSPLLMASLSVSALGTMALKNSKKSLPPLLEETAMAMLAMLPSLVALRRSRAIQYHAAEHKSINAYEKSGSLDEQTALKARSEHVRCGSNIIGPALALMTVGNAIARRFLGRQSQAARLGVGILSFSGAMEMIHWAGRNPGNVWAKLLTSAGGGLQSFITTREPTEDQLEVGLAALRELLKKEGLEASGPVQG